MPSSPPYALEPLMRILAASIAAVVLMSGCGANASPEPSQPRLTVEKPITTPSPSKTVRKVAEPKRIRIPSIDVDAKVIKVGLLPNDDMETPPAGRNLAGWYSPKPSPGKKRQRRPGEVGPAVIAAHVDSNAKADVFARLDEMKPGDKIQVTDTNGETYTFTMQRMKQTPKDKLPKREIWDPTDGPALRLITCAGAFASGHYLDNVTIFADAA